VISFVFERDFSRFKEVEMRVVDYQFHPETSEETKNLVHESLTTLYDPGFRSHTKAFLSPMELLKMAIERLERMQSIQAHHPNLPHSLPLTDLLTNLASSMKREEGSWKIPEVVEIKF